MKPLILIAAGLVIPAAITLAQTPAMTGGQVPYIPLFSSGGGGDNGTGGAVSGGTNSTWYIDTARNLIVLCTQVAAGTGGTTGAPAFTCTAQALRMAPGAAAPPGAPDAAGSAGANPMGASRP